jgi:D-cysteine desulfhydrase
MNRLLFERYPAARSRVPFTPRVALPTPVLEHRGVWVKRDDTIGGAKLRKLEFYDPPGELLAWGPRGSNWLRSLLRFRSARVLTFPQRHNEHSRRNLAHIPGEHCPDTLSFGLRMLAELPRILGGSVTLVPLGGSEPGTTLGFVNGAFELADQVRRGECPRPDAVFVPLGTCGVAAGLALGFALAGLDVALHAVRVAYPASARLRNLYGLASQASWLLDERPRACRVLLETGFYGGYGAATAEGRAAQEFFRPFDLDTSYSAKAAACLLARRPLYRTPLLWLTYGATSAQAGAPEP